MGNRPSKDADPILSTGIDNRVHFDSGTYSVQITQKELPAVGGNGTDSSSSSVKNGGLKVFTAMIFVIGEMAGSGVIALPRAIVNTGVSGFILMFVCCFLAAFTGRVLGKCWTILQERFEVYRKCTRDPYPAIAFEACGKPGRILISMCNNITLFGITVVFLLLVAEIVEGVLSYANVDISRCYWVLIIATVLTPLTWLGTPKDMSFLAVGATGTTLVAVILIFAKMIYILPDLPVPTHTSPDKHPTGMSNFMLGFGTIVFAFGNHSVLPTVQHDMRNPSKFTRVVYGAFSVVLIAYLPIAVTGYIAFGDSVGDNLLATIQIHSPGPILIIVQCLLALHLLCSLVILVNPVCQEIEDKINIPHNFNWKRALIRTIVICSMVFIAESIPRFGAILSLIGGSTVAALAFIFPIVFYIKLCRLKGPWRERAIPLYQYVMFGEILIFAVVAIVASTYSAVLEIVSPNTFVPPCYISLDIM